MVEEGVDLVQSVVDVDRRARVPHGVAGRIFEDALVAACLMQTHTHTDTQTHT